VSEGGRGTPPLKEALAAALSDRYQLLDEIGRGGMATVYLARDLRHDARVAVKVLRPELALAMGGERFLREIHISATLQHPNILPVLDSGEAAGTSYFVMPFVEGESLQQRLQRETRLPVDEAVRLIAEVADGLAHAHKSGFVHRDIKPGNILLSHGHAIVADFGVARALDASAEDRLTESGLSVGTVSYMSPEQAGAGRLDGRSDIYSLACVLYEALSGTPPFTGPSAQAVMARSAIDPVPSIRTLRQGVPQALEAAINKALAKVPEDRFPDAASFRNEIIRAAAMPILTDTALPARRPWWRGKRVALAAGIVVALGAGLAIVSRFRAVTPLDANRVIVYPLVLSSDWPGARTSGEDVATIIGSAMDGAGSLRWVDGWQLLKPEQRDNIRLLTVLEAEAIARAQHCAYAVTGRLVARGDSADVFLELYDVRGDSVLARPQGRSAPVGESWRGGMRAVTDILPRLIPGAVPDVESGWKARPPRAVAHFLLGEAAFRRVQLADALAEFRHAIEVDSTFGLAAVRGAQVATWNHQPNEAGSLIRVALRSGLSPRYRLFASGFGAYLDGRADSAVARLHATLALDSTMVAAWLQLGEVYMHLLPTEGGTDSLAEAAFERARALDLNAATSQFHLVEILARRGDQSGARNLAQQFMKVAVDTQLAREVELVSDCGRQGFGNTDLHEAALRRPLPLSLAAKALGASTVTARCAMAAYQMLLQADTAGGDAPEGRRFFALLGLVNGMVGRERPADAMMAIDEFQRRWGFGLSLYLLAAPVEPALADRARAVARQDSVDFGAQYAGVRYPVRLWELGVWAAREGRVAVARAVALNLTARSAGGTRLDSLLAASMMGHAALADGDSLGALRRFETLVAQPAPVEELSWNEVASLGFDRLVLGRLLIWRKEYARAMRILEVHDSALPAVFPLYLRASLAMRLEAATALKQPATEASLRARIAELSTE
jgi:tRNA A-37 threonylcarbamoyl transferase component Bud32/tetratricopeptide (TPR) repeat protein